MMKGKKGKKEAELEESRYVLDFVPEVFYTNFLVVIE